MTTARAELGPGRHIEGVRFLEHTADIGIEAEAESMAGCLARAAAGLFGLMFIPPAYVERDRRAEMELEAASAEELLVGWLQELLYRSEVEGTCFLRFEVETDGRSLRGRAWGIPIGDAEPAGPAVKGVTRHALALSERRGRWRARVLVDV
jgi:SHS2 domain-containing protein